MIIAIVKFILLVALNKLLLATVCIARANITGYVGKLAPNYVQTRKLCIREAVIAMLNGSESSCMLGSYLRCTQALHLKAATLAGTWTVMSTYNTSHNGEMLAKNPSFDQQITSSVSSLTRFGHTMANPQRGALFLA